MTENAAVRQYTDLCWKMVHRFRSVADPDALMSQARLGLLAAIRGYEAAGRRGSLTVWAYRNITWEMLKLADEVRGRVPTVPIDDLDGYEPADTAASPEDELAAAELRALLRSAVENLQGQERDVLRHALTGGTAAEWARKRGCSRQNVFNIEQRAIAKVRAVMVA